MTINSEYSKASIGNYCILEEFHSMQVTEIEKAVKNHKIKNGLLYFKDLEAIADKVTRQIINGMMNMKKS